MGAPRVKYKERDLSAYAPSNDGITAAIVIAATKGPVNKPILASSRKQFLANFTPQSKVGVGYPTGYFSALTVLEATGNLLVVRAAAPDIKYSGLDVGLTTTASWSAGELDPNAVVPSGTTSFIVAAASPGAWANDYKVTVHGYKTDETVSITESGAITSQQTWGRGFPVKFVGETLPTGISANTVYFVIPTVGGVINIASSMNNGGAPILVNLTPSEVVSAKIVPAIQYTKTPGTMLISVFHKDNLNEPVDSYVVSKTPGTKNLDGYSLYLEDVVNKSAFIQVIDNILVSATYVQDVVTPISLAGGVDGSAVSDADFVRALQTLSNSNEYDIKLILDGGRTTPAYHNALISICEDRQDCVPILSAPLSTQSGISPAQDIVNFRKYEANFNTSYGALYAPHVKILDEFNNREIFVAPDGVVAKAIIDTAANFEIWYPVGGDTRGVVNVLDTKVHFSEPEQDLLYDNGINPIIFEAGQGIKIWGQKTLLSTPSMLDRLNVRLMLIVIGPAIKRLLKSFLFDFNDEPTRAIAKAKIDSYMNSIVARRGVTRFLTICDTTNNTPNDIDNHRLVVDLLVCPNNSVEDIPFTIGIVNNSVSFDLAQQQL